MSSCLALEQPMKIAFLGPAGRSLQAAALKHFGHAALTKPMGNISEVFEAVEKRHVILVLFLLKIQQRVWLLTPLIIYYFPTKNLWGIRVANCLAFAST